MINSTKYLLNETTLILIYLILIRQDFRFLIIFLLIELGTRPVALSRDMTADSIVRGREAKLDWFDLLLNPQPRSEWTLLSIQHFNHSATKSYNLLISVLQYLKKVKLIFTCKGTHKSRQFLWVILSSRGSNISVGNPCSWVYLTVFGIGLCTVTNARFLIMMERYINQIIC